MNEEVNDCFLILIVCRVTVYTLLVPPQDLISLLIQAQINKAGCVCVLGTAKFGKREKNQGLHLSGRNWVEVSHLGT